MPYKDKEDRTEAVRRCRERNRELTIYQPKQLRSQLINGERYWCVADICEELGILNYSQSIKEISSTHVLKIYVVAEDGKQREMLFVDYAGALEISLQSRKPKAKELRIYVAQQMKDKIDMSPQLNRIEERLERIEDKLETKPQIIAIDMSPRSRINKLVRDYAKRKDIPHSHVWGTLYMEFEYRYHVNLVVTARNRGISPLQRVEDLELIKEMRNLAISLFNGQ